MENKRLQQQEKDFFNELYKGKKILIKLSGAEIADPNFETVVKDIKALIADQIKIILVFGGGNQIDAEWQKKGHTEPRPKENGVGISSPEVMYDGVLPAHESVLAKLKKYFENVDQVSFLETDQIKGEIKDFEKSGFTGTPTEIPLQGDKKLQIVGFVGETEEGEKLNINADEVVTKIIEQQKKQIIEVIFATQTGGIQDTEKNIVPTISNKKIPCILENNHPEIEVDGGMLKKVKEAQKILEHVNKVAITNLKGIYDEITKLSGSGTLLLNLEKSKIVPLNNSEIFDLQYAEKIKSKEWLPRTKAKIDELKQNHFVLSINESPLGGFSLLEKEIEISDQKTDVLSFECWWADAKQNGIGLHLLKHAMQIAENQEKTFAMFTKLNFDIFADKLGLKKYPEIKSTSGAILWTTQKTAKKSLQTAKAICSKIL